MVSKVHVLRTIGKILRDGFQDKHIYQFDVDTSDLDEKGKITITLAGVPAKKSVEKITELMTEEK